MYQIDVATASSTLPVPAAAGTPGYFTDGDVVAGIPPTVVPADWLNAIMLEFLNVLAAAGVVPSKVVDNQLVTAIETLIESRSGNYLVDTGSANAYVVAASPPITSYEDGLQVRVKIGHTNTGASVLNAGAGNEPIVREDGQPPAAGDLPIGYIVTFNYSAAASAWQIDSLVPSQFGSAAKAAASSGTGVVAAVSGATTVAHLAQFSDTGGTVANGPSLSSAQSTVAAVSGATTVSHLAKFFDVAGTLANGPALSSAQNTVAAVSGATTAGNFASFSDGSGTVQDSGISPASINSTAAAALYQLGYLL